MRSSPKTFFLPAKRKGLPSGIRRRLGTHARTGPLVHHSWGRRGRHRSRDSCKRICEGNSPRRSRAFPCHGGDDLGRPLSGTGEVGLVKAGAALEMTGGFALQGLIFVLAVDFSHGSKNWPALIGIQSLALAILGYALKNRLAFEPKTFGHQLAGVAVFSATQGSLCVLNFAGPRPELRCRDYPTGCTGCFLADAVIERVGAGCGWFNPWNMNGQRTREGTRSITRSSDLRITFKNSCSETGSD